MYVKEIDKIVMVIIARGWSCIDFLNLYFKILHNKHIFVLSQATVEMFIFLKDLDFYLLYYFE